MHILGRESSSEQEDGIVLIRWTIAVRTLATLASWIAIYAEWYFGIIQYDPRFILFVLLPAYLACNLIWYFSAIKKVGIFGFLYASFVVDLLLITFAVYVSGQIMSSFIFLYAVVLINAAVISLEATIAFAALSLILYALLMFYSGVGIDRLLIGPLLQHTSALVVIIIVIATQSYFFISRIRRREKEISDLKEGFLFRMVHDLRAPCTVIKLVMDKCSDPEFLKKPEAGGHMEMVRQANYAILELINDILDIGRSTRPRMDSRPAVVELTGLLLEILKELSPIIETKNIHAHYDMPEISHRFFADRKQIREALVNVVENAVKYNKDGGGVTISSSIENVFLQISVKDTGVGIGKEEMERIFSPFYRADSAGGIRGTGLGLFSAKKLVELNSGKIEISSEIGVGTEVRIWLPIK